MDKGIVLAPGRFQGRVRAAVSKSDAHRALIAAALAEGESHLSDWGESDDIRFTLKALKALGLIREQQENRITGGGSSEQNPEVFCGQSGSTLRFLIPLAVTLGTGAIFTGEGRLMERPLTVYQEAFEAQGIKWRQQDGRLTIKGKLHGGRISLPGGVSSQFVTGLCFALPLQEKDSVLTFTTPLESRPYVDMTLDTLKAFGIHTHWEQGTLRIPGRQRYHPAEYTIEGDWSYAAFWLTAGAMGGDVTVAGLRTDSMQGDRAIAGLLTAMGAKISFEEDGVRARGGLLAPGIFDLADIPDLAPILAVAACAARGDSTFLHARRLTMKESNRREAIFSMVESLGGRVGGNDDTFVIRGSGALSHGKVDTLHDHRMAMAAAVATAISTGQVELDDRRCVSKSAPEFWEHYRKLGGKIIG